uniref:PH domain-containing protein n=1 Tax=Steinernema glaseri TaxID=37863 RepID=A0A1I8AGW0_9BILA
MFHLAPVGITPVHRPNKNQVAQIEDDLKKAVVQANESKAQNKRLNIDDPGSKYYLKVLDVIFSHGLLQGDRCYWRFVQEFIPKFERSVIQREWQAKSERALSISWLKDSLNKNTLHFQVLGISANGQNIVQRFYHKNACLYAKDARLQIANQIGSVSFNFNFRMPNIERQEDEPVAAVEEEPVAAVAPIARPNARKSRRVERLRAQQVTTVPAPQSSIHDLTRELTEAALNESVHVPYLSTKDQEYLLEAMINRHNRTSAKETVHHDHHTEQAQPSFSQSHSPPSQPVPSEQPNKDQAQMDEVLRKTISKVKLEQEFDGDDCLPRSFDSFVFPEIKLKEVPKEDDDYDEVDGEVILEPGETIEMAMKVFLEETEGFRKLFLVYSGHGAGTPVTRQLLLTDRNIYLISEKTLGIEAGSEALPSSSQEANGLLLGSPRSNCVDYIVHAVIPLASIDCITVAVDHQVVWLQANEKRFHLPTSDQGTSCKIISVDTASERLGKAIVHFVEKAIKACGLKAPIIDLGPTAQSIVLKRFLVNELGISHVDIAYHGLVYWFQSGWKKSVEQSSKAKDEFAGFLYHRSFAQNSWRKAPSEWNHHYFVIQGQQLFKFTDSTCKLCEEKITLTTSCMISEVDLKKDERFVIQLETGDASSNVIQFSCASREDMKRWKQKFSVAISKPDVIEAPTACSLVLTDNAVLAAQEGANCIVDGFMRCLVMVPLQRILQVIGVRIGSYRGILVHSEKDNLEWFLVRSDDELNRLQAAFEQKFRIRLVNYSDRDSIGRKLSDFIGCEVRKLPNDLWHPDYGF